jgi:hypothetical protein
LARGALAALMWSIGLLSDAIAAELPAIKSGPGNEVPRCVRPAKLMAFVRNRNRNLDPPREIHRRFLDIAGVYRRIGNCVQQVEEKCDRVRWDYAFFQMLIESNYLTFRTPEGQAGGVSAWDNNFAGIGATVAGKPGEKFKDVNTGVLAHLQHVLMYSGTKVIDPVAERTRLVEARVMERMRSLGRPPTFADLATLWTSGDHDRYAADIAGTAVDFAALYCRAAARRRAESR